MESLLVIALVGWLAVALLMVCLFFIQFVIEEADVVDVGWAASVGLLAIFFALVAPGEPARRALVAIMVAGWGFRLAGHLLFNRAVKRGEDGRYAALRAHWGSRAHRNFFLFFQVQAAWAVLFALPPLWAMSNASPDLRVWDLLGVAVWLVALGGESLADRQLERFRARPDSRGKTCREGLWRYSRHPNYFFEWVHWWSYVLIGVGAPLGWWTLLGPVIMLIFLYRITGIPYTEKQALKSRGDDYRDYQRTTSAFIPWFPKEPTR